MTGKRGPNWRPNEDEILCRAWVSISEDGAVGTNQKYTRLWERVAAEHQKWDPTTIRTAVAMESRMRIICYHCNAWKGVLQRAQRHQSSGTNQFDVEKEARAIYKQENGNKAFDFEHCFEILRNCPKWYSNPDLLVSPIPPMGQGSQSSTTGFGSQSSPVEGLDDLPDEGATPFVLTRPEGRDKQKAAKKKGKVVAESSDIYTTQLLEFGNDMRERQKSRMEYENRKMNVQERRLEQEKEEWAYKRQVREREAEKWAVEKKEREAAILQQNVAILEKDLSKMTPRKKRF
ncbi:unnamed protein product [Linum trigynum]|uniref:No apical meristem-associated C-terminal domain-containing protein n=1 Tax=Linum trigynum TaxID=586398 RepID=A0AAV2G9F7_9ROSI